MSDGGGCWGGSVCRVRVEGPTPTEPPGGCQGVFFSQISAGPAHGEALLLTLAAAGSVPRASLQPSKAAAAGRPSVEAAVHEGGALFPTAPTSSGLMVLTSSSKLGRFQSRVSDSIIICLTFDDLQDQIH